MNRIKWMIIGVLFSGLVFGQATKTFRVDAPTQRVNNDPQPVNELQTYRIKCGSAAGGPYDVIDLPFPATGNASEAFTAEGAFPEGNYWCVATVDNQHGESDASNEINFTVGRCDSTDCRPKAPSLSVIN